MTTPPAQFEAQSRPQRHSDASAATLRTLAWREIVQYARSWLFLIGAGGTAALTVAGFVQDDGSSSTMSMIAPAALLGLLGMIVMANLTARSDRAAEAAGALAVGQSTRTKALAAAACVPVAAALAWFVAAIVQYHVQPAEPWAVPFGPVSDAHVWAVMFALGVVPAASGPIVGLLVARWLRWRGSAVVVAVVVVVVTIVMQGNFQSTWRWHVVWPWTYWYGPVGWGDSGGDGAPWKELPGSPFWWLGYLIALCVLGVLVALYRDPEASSARRRLQIVIVAAVAVATLVATMMTGLPAPVINPLIGTAF